MKKLIFRSKIKELKKKHPDLRFWSDHCALELYKINQKNLLLREFLGTVAAKKTAEQIFSRVGDKHIYTYDIDRDPGHIFVQFKIFTREGLDKLVKFMDAFGWYPSAIIDHSDPGGDFSGKFSEEKIKVNLNKKLIIVVFEAKYDEEVDISNIRYAYHIAPDVVIDKIKTTGLTPKGQGKLASHPERIYVLLERDLGNFIQLAVQLAQASKNRDRIEKMYILKIDLNKLKNISFYKDPNFGDSDQQDQNPAAYTYSNIPPNAIEIMSEFDVSKYLKQ